MGINSLLEQASSGHQRNLALCMVSANILCSGNPNTNDGVKKEGKKC